VQYWNFSSVPPTQNNSKFSAPFRGTFLCKQVNAENHEHTTTNQNEREVMNDKFDELAKGLAQSVTRRGALKKFGGGLAGIVLTSMGLANKVRAQQSLECIHWQCRRHSKFGEWIDLYVCGGNHPHYPNATCGKVGVVACGYCDNCC
jgi:hypothetical protein